MTAPPAPNYTRFAVAIVLVVVIGASLIGTAYLRTNSAAPKTNTSGTQTSETTPSNTGTSTSSTSATSTSTSSSSNSSSYWSAQPYMNASKVYASLGYPKVTYDDYTTSYVPSEPNMTLYDYTDDTSYPVGTIEVPALTLNQAVDLAAAYAKLDPTNYTLGEAVFVPGSVFNGTMISYPTWALYFAQIQGGYWIYGDQGPYSLSLEVNVDALTDKVLGTQGNELNLLSPGQYNLSVSSSTALETVRASNLSGVPAALTGNGAVSFIEPRVVVPGQLDSSVSGLAWIIDLDKSNGEGALLGQFVVDAGTGELITGTAEQGYATESGTYSGSIDFPTADNLVISQESIEINGSIIVMPGSVPVSVSDVLMAKPGSSGSVEVNLTALDTSNPTSVTLSFVNPLPGY